jgi:hypothetical protein
MTLPGVVRGDESVGAACHLGYVADVRCGRAGGSDASGNGNDRHVVERNDGWAVVEEDQKRTSTSARTLAETIDRARDRSQRRRRTCAGQTVNVP